MSATGPLAGEGAAARPATERPGGTAANAAITSLSQAASMIAGGVLAVLIAVLVGNDASTDGFFAAYAVYSVAVLFAQSARTTIVARLLESPTRFGAFDRFLGAGLLIALVLGIAFVPLGGVIAGALTGDLPGEAQDTARLALLLLWPAIAAQLFSALGAAMLAVLGNYVVAAIAFGGGGVVSILAFVALRPALGIDGVSAALLVGAAFMSLAVAVALMRRGWRPTAATVREPRESVRAAGVLGISSLSFLISQVGFVITLSLGARLGEGIVTVFTYAYMAMGLVQALLASSIGMVLAAPLAETWDRRPETLAPHNVDVFRAGVLLLVPVVAAAWLVGQEAGDVVLAKFTGGEVELTVELFLLLVPNVVWAMATSIAFTALFIKGGYKWVALVTAVVVVLQAALSVLAVAVDSAHLLALAVPISTFVAVPPVLMLVDRRYPRIVVPPLLATTLRLLLVTTVAFVLPSLVLPDVAAFLLGCLLYVGGVSLLLPAERAIGGRLLGAFR
jgi:peptidoglycan biosynthesis protein MviN/MurJ (putative lipid II flippase)